MQHDDVAIDEHAIDRIIALGERAISAAKCFKSDRSSADLDRAGTNDSARSVNRGSDPDLEKISITAWRAIAPSRAIRLIGGP